MTVLITGLAQPIGQYLLELCLEQELQVRVLVGPGESLPRLRSDGFEPITGSLAEPAAIERAVRGVDIVYHTAATAQGSASVLRDANAAATRRLLEACAGDVRRFVFVSNPAVYCEHPTPDTWPVRADASREPHGPPQLIGYGQSLVEAEDYVFEAGRRYGMEYCVLRLATIWGRNNYASFVVNSLMHRPEMAEQMYRMLGPMQWLHGGDAARAVLLAGEAAAARNETFIVAGAEALTCFDVLASLWEITRPSAPNPFRDDDAAHRLRGPKLDIGKIEQVLGFRPMVTVQQCLEELLDQADRATARPDLPSANASPARAAATADMSGKTCVITGATSGIGLATAEQLAAMGARLVLVGRNHAKGEQALQQVRSRGAQVDVSIHNADLERMSEVRRVAADILAAEPRIDVLINCAGAVFDHRELTEDGFERTFAINHMAHFLLTALLRERLIASAPARIITVASIGHHGVALDFEDLQGEREFDPQTASKRSKLCNILFTRELTRRLSGTGVTANCLCPGFVATGIGSNTASSHWWALAKRSAILPQEGARTPIYLASSREVDGVSGGFFVDCQIEQPSIGARDPTAALLLWKKSEALCGLSEDLDTAAG
jgi:nucleoside-diphosphate-sugar epimerase